jgi:hypothetical protein
MEQTEARKEAHTETRTRKPGLPHGKVSRADRRLAKLIAFLESKLDSNSEKVQAQAVDRLAEILLKQLELKDRKEERADRKAERELKRDLSGFRRATPEEDAQIKAELEKVLGKGDDEDVDPFA